MKNKLYLFLFCSIGLQFGCMQYCLRDTSSFELKKQELKFLKSKKFALVGFFPYHFANGMRGIQKEEPHFPCSYYDTLKDIDKSQATYNCIVEFINDGKKDAYPDLYKKIFVSVYGGKYQPSYYAPATIPYDTSTEAYFPTENEVRKQKVSIGDNSIPDENLRKFLLNHLSLFRHAGLPELESILSFEYAKIKDTCSCNLENKQEKLVKIQLKKMEVDYWILANHKQLYSGYGDRSNYENEPTLKVLTFLPAILTYGTIPYWDEAVFESKFFIYDKNLNLVKTFTFTNKYDFIAAWWLMLKKQNYASAYEPDVKELTKELHKMIQTQ
ncbi:MAG TPA: hypothetical protein PK079_02090 [Leptospiraceae bacterium]|nr:hypothetical protein [Leptospiraceae bacterium]HMW03507.1 hypothetical protein [Leptospiraceae bacterium]HMX33470.1 hypothetical protein [Leptospiraceae bacterium]HMY29573.1 hypothetical protein [Leptospiraceae bacterium]HMZ62937.1 hypothetical protein [Leptospiraceae bacterium]